jgi:hypothetical protein
VVEGSKDILDLDALMRASLVFVRGLGEVELNPDAHAARAEVARHQARPFGLNYRAFANRVLGASLEPAQSAVVVDALPEAERRRLMHRAADLKGQDRAWKALHGSHLSWDERFFAVMSHALRRERKDRAALRREAARLTETFKLPWTLQALTGLSPFTSFGPTRDLQAATGVSKLMRDAIGPRTALKAPTFLNDSYSHLAKAATGLGFEERLRGPALSAMVGPSARGYDATAFNPNFLKSISQAQQVSKSIEQLHLRPGLEAASYMRVAAGFKGVTTQSEIARMVDRATGVSRSWGPLAAMYAMPGGPLSNLNPAERWSRGVLGTNVGRLGGFDPSRWWIDPVGPWIFPEPDPAEEQFVAQWERDPLWFLVGDLAVVVLQPMFALPRGVVLGRVLDALEAAVLGGPLITWLRAAVAEAPYVTEEQRHQLDRGLCEAANGDWVIAPVLLLVGLEGAMSMTPQAQKAMAASPKFLAAEALVRHLGVDETHERFVKTRVYGGPGNKVRHGREGASHREQTLLAIAALAGWLDTQAKAQTMNRLIAALSSGLRGRGTLQEP